MSLTQAVKDELARDAEERRRRESAKQIASAQDGGPPAPKNGETNAEIERLAKLSAIEYEREREAAAEKLCVRVSAIDAVVKAHRNEATEQANTLPHWNVEPAPEVVTGAELLDAIKDEFERYVVLPPHTAVAITLWVMHTWAIAVADISPILALISPEKRCGKTTLLKLLNRLARKASLASNISTAALFRYIEAEKPTLLIDEADSFLRDNEEMRGVLNSGHSREAAFVIRCEGDDMTPRRFSTWAPKAIACIKKLPSTLMDRSITVPMRRKLKTEKRPRYRDRDRDEFQIIRSQALRWTGDNEKTLPHDPAVPNALDDRSADNWRPLIAIANLAGDEWPEAARKAALALSGVGDDTDGIRLLRDIKWIFDGRPGKEEDTGEMIPGEEPVDRMWSSILVSLLVGIEDSTWADWPKKGFTQTVLAELLEPFTIRPTTVRIGTKTLKGYMLASFKEAFESYLGDQEPATPVAGGVLPVTPSQPNKDGPNLNILPVTQKNPVTAEKSQKPASNGHCYAVTGKSTPRSGGEVSCRVTITEIRHPALSAGPHDRLDDFTAF